MTDDLRHVIVTLSSKMYIEIVCYLVVLQLTALRGVSYYAIGLSE